MFCKKLTVVITRMPPYLQGRQMCSQSWLFKGQTNEQARPADIDDGGIASAAQSVQSAAEVAAEDVNSVPPTTDSVPVSDGDAGMGEEPLIAGDGGHCVADMGTSTTTHAGDDQSCPWSSNIVSRMKKVPHLRKASRIRGSGHCSPSAVYGNVVNDEDVILVVPIAIVPTEGEVDAHAVPDVTLKVRFAGVKAYLTWTLSPAELDLLAAARARCKGLEDDQWNFDLPEASVKHVNAEFLKGLIDVVPTQGAADRPGKYCMGSFAVHQYCKLLDFHQREHKRYYRMFIFLNRHDQGLLSKPKHATCDIWETLKAQKDSNLCYVMEVTDMLSASPLPVRTDGLYFGKPYVCQARDKLLLSLLQGSVTHFPQAFLQAVTVLRLFIFGAPMWVHFPATTLENTSRKPYVSGGERVNHNTVTGDGAGADGNMKEVGVHSLYDTDKE
ncbi:hypothetical protein Cgig2_007079 [Carnegiea gigantea]|uniref:Uncharacterized protein n=1 Tax=Carnegiea gigantea TaxID=171969 RepID=A0A9Q1GS02_9CARY|nr:hypothetical protein Cgig2_007079 [Carnegiea gigantea]